MCLVYTYQTECHDGYTGLRIVVHQRHFLVARFALHNHNNNKKNEKKKKKEE